MIPGTAPRENALTRAVRLLHKLNLALVSQEEGDSLPIQITIRADGTGFIYDEGGHGTLYHFYSPENLVEYLEADTRTRLHMSRGGQ